MPAAGQAARVANQVVPAPVNAATNMAENQAAKNVAGYIEKITKMSYNNLNGLNNQRNNSVRAAIAARKQKISNNVTALLGEIGTHTNIPTLNAVKTTNVRYKNASAANKGRINETVRNRRSNLTRSP
jgi:hypothetical protein